MAEILSGWKDIANYMGKGVRTVQRYERELGLPIRRASGRPKASVLVTKTELDGWIEAAFHHEASYDDNSLKLQNLRCKVSEVTALLDQLKQSINELATARLELATARTAARPAARRSHNDLFHTGVRWKNISSEVA